MCSELSDLYVKSSPPRLSVANKALGGDRTPPTLRLEFANPSRIPHHYWFVQENCALRALQNLNPQRTVKEWHGKAIKDCASQGKIGSSAPGNGRGKHHLHGRRRAGSQRKVAARRLADAARHHPPR